jgi:glycosyltransferase involved in cell wall biosynthesis
MFIAKVFITKVLKKIFRHTTTEGSKKNNLKDLAYLYYPINNEYFEKNKTGDDNFVVSTIFSDENLKNKKILEIGIEFSTSTISSSLKNKNYIFIDFNVLESEINKVDSTFFLDMKFDLIYFSEGLEIAYNPWLIIEKLNTVLLENGLIIINANYSKYFIENKSTNFQISLNGIETLFNRYKNYETKYKKEKNYFTGRYNENSDEAKIHRPISFPTDFTFCSLKLPLDKKVETNSKNIVNNLIQDNKKLNILIGCLSFKSYTGSELYVYELAKGLIQDGHKVSICSDIGLPLAEEAESLGISLYSLNSPPGYVLGDGIKTVSQNSKTIINQENTLYKISDVSYDILHLNHQPITEHLLRLYPKIPAICSIHSEVIDLEFPVFSSQIKKYIAIRQEIKDFLVQKFNLPQNKIELIYNPIDEERFKPINIDTENRKKRILFVGTIDYLRKDTIIDLINTCKQNQSELWIVGKEHENYLPALINNQHHVRYFKPSKNIENYIYQCDETAGILLGRTTIEGWMCGKKGWIYEIDNKGKIMSKKLYNIPEDIDKFKSKKVTKEMLNQYFKILNIEQ